MFGRDFKYLAIIGHIIIGGMLRKNEVILIKGGF